MSYRTEDLALQALCAAALDRDGALLHELLRGMSRRELEAVADVGVLLRAGAEIVLHVRRRDES